MVFSSENHWSITKGQACRRQFIIAMIGDPNLSAFDQSRNMMKCLAHRNPLPGESRQRRCVLVNPNQSLSCGRTISAEERACCWRVASSAWLGKGADEDSLGRQAQCAPDCRRQLNQNEIICGIQIIFTGLVNNPNVLSLSGGGIGQDLIDFSNFQRSRVTLVADTDCKLWFGGNLRAAHRCLFHYALDFEFLLTQAAGFIPMVSRPGAICHLAAAL